MGGGVDIGFLLAVVVVVAWAVHASAGYKQRWNELFDALAAEFGGQCRSDEGLGGLLSAKPVLLLPLRGTEYAGRLRFHSTGGKQSTLYTEFSAPLPASAWTLSVEPEGLFQKVAQLLGAQDVKTGDAAFDAAFSIRSSDPPQAASFLGRPEIQEALRALKGLAGNGYIELRVEGGAFRVRKISWLQEREAAREFLDKSLRLYHAFPGAYPPGP